jgi:hypothetical protein
VPGTGDILPIDMRVLLVAVVLLVKPGPLEARCPSSLDAVWNITAKEKPADPVFSGTVAAVTNVPGGQVAIFEVDRAWRGRVPMRVTVYNVTGEVTSDGTELTLSTAQRVGVGLRYFVFTHKPNDKERLIFGLKDSTALATQGCGIFLRHR